MENLGGDTKQAIDQLDLGENVALFCFFYLPFSNHVHCLITGQCALRRVEGKETQAGPGAALDEAVVLLDEIIEVFDLAQLARHWSLFLRFQGLHGLWVGGVFIDVDHPRRDGVRCTECFVKEGLSCRCVPFDAQEEVDGLPIAIHRAILIKPFAFNLDRGLIYFPRVVGWF